MKKPEKSAMLAEKVVQKAKPTEACGRRIAQGGLIALLAQTKRLKGWRSLRGGGDRNPLPLRLPLWFLSGDAERNVKKKLKSIKISVFLKY